MILLTALAALAVAVVIAVKIGRAIRQPLERVIEIFRKMASGKLDNPIDAGRLKTALGIAQMTEFKGNLLPGLPRRRGWSVRRTSRLWVR